MIVLGLIAIVLGAVFGVRALVLLGVAAFAVGLILIGVGHAAY